MIWNDPNMALKITVKGKAKYLHKGDEIPPNALNTESVEKFKTLGRIVDKLPEKEDKKTEKPVIKKAIKK